VGTAALGCAKEIHGDHGIMAILCPLLPLFLCLSKVLDLPITRNLLTPLLPFAPFAIVAVKRVSDVGD